VGIFLGTGILLWIPVVIWTDFTIPAFMLEFIREETFNMSEARVRWVLVKGGLLGLVVIGVGLATLLFAQEKRDRCVPIWAIAILALVTALILSALILPPDVVVQLYWILCAMLSTSAALVFVRPGSRIATQDSTTNT
jgi:hypothetical protein